MGIPVVMSLSEPDCGRKIEQWGGSGAGGGGGGGGGEFSYWRLRARVPTP